MKESAFDGTVKEGFKRRFTVLNENDLEKYVPEEKLGRFNEVLNDVLFDIELGREEDGKHKYNSYVVINLDEPYIDDVIDILKKNGHWG